MIRTFLAAAILSTAAHAAMSDHVVLYNINASLDPAAHTVTGKEMLTWRNTSTDPIRELQFHLYLNAFQNEKSTFMRESGGHLRGDTASKNSWG